MLSYFNEQAKLISKEIFQQKSLFCLGKGFGESIAKEIALKIKEVSYIHAEGINALNFKHGPISMIDPKERTPVIIIIDKNDHFDELKSIYEIAKHKNANMIVITNAKEHLDIQDVDFIIDIPNEGFLSSFYGVFIGQLLAYYCCIYKDLNPDKPRNLSKEVTV